MVEVVDREFLLWFCCLSCLQMLFELWADVKTSQVPRCIRSVTSKLGLINEKELNTHPDDTKRGRRLVVCTGKFFCFLKKKHRREVKMKERLKSVEIKKPSDVVSHSTSNPSCLLPSFPSKQPLRLFTIFLTIDKNTTRYFNV